MNSFVLVYLVSASSRRKHKSSSNAIQFMIFIVRVLGFIRDIESSECKHVGDQESRDPQLELSILFCNSSQGL
ncbi:hypothetical protein ACMD2_13922 [Ananas comosus]|uniref:Uncharacterized protein n=1 Tax=Ananas comosus TaxID=4615 RepID=A0A199UP09_ANACO|nr:hypothetical protein ACMD2_13922 [Ananas comosus]